MNKTHYFCDKCKKEVNSQKDLKLIVVGWDCYDIFSSRFVSKIAFELCRECTKPLGLFWKEKDDPIPPRDETTEQKLYGIMAQLISEIAPQQVKYD